MSRSTIRWTTLSSDRNTNPVLSNLSIGPCRYASKSSSSVRSTKQQKSWTCLPCVNALLKNDTGEQLLRLYSESVDLRNGGNGDVHLFVYFTLHASKQFGTNCMGRECVHICVLLDVDVLYMSERMKGHERFRMSADTGQTSLSLRDIEPSLHQNVFSISQYDNTDISKRIAEIRGGTANAFSLLEERFPFRAHIGSNVTLVVCQSKIQMKRYCAVLIIESVIISELRLIVQERSQFPHLVFKADMNTHLVPFFVYKKL